MFKKLKEKLAGWFKKTEEKAEEITEAEEEPEEVRKTEEEPGEEIRKDKKEPEEKVREVEKEIEKIIEPKEEKPEEKGLFRKVSIKFKFKITEENFDGIFSDLELILLENNVALKVIEKIKLDLKKELVGVSINKKKIEEEIKKALKISIESLIEEPFDLLKKIKQHKEQRPFVILFFGINGSGKTTTIAKISHLLKKNNFSCILAASDTFRAASIEQLEKHGEKLNLKVIKSQYGADPASVAYDAIKHAQAQKIKAVLIDTAGRMHTQTSLMKEMEKISRVAKPDLKIFVAESITGNDAVEQAKTFNEAVGIDAIILSKADVDEKSGTILSVSYITGKPILYLGTGQKYEDLEKFKKSKIIERLGL